MTTVLHQQRHMRGETAQAVADRVGCSQPTILRAERGLHVPNPRVRAALEAHYRMPWQMLLSPLHPS